MKVDGIYESSLYVKDLAVAQEFYDRVFGFREIFREEGRLHALSVSEKQVLLLFAEGRSTDATDTPGGRIPPHDGHGQLHLAFMIQRSEVAEWQKRLVNFAVEIESEVACQRGGHSIYFRDPDNHLLELITPGCWSIS